MGQESKSSMEQGDREILDAKLVSKAYQKPLLKIYGDVRHLTQSTGTKNGDGGQNMML